LLKRPFGIQDEITGFRRVRSFCDMVDRRRWSKSSGAAPFDLLICGIHWEGKFMAVFKLLASSTVAVLIAGGAAAQAPSSPVSRAAPSSALIPTQEFTLPNGLTVIFHIDRSDPVVAVALNAHVGSARELPGRTGFAHMFEHLFSSTPRIWGRAASTR